MLQYHRFLRKSWQAVRDEKPFEKSDGATQRVHCSQLTNNSAEEWRGDGAVRGFLWITLAYCGEGEECWDEGCPQESNRFLKGADLNPDLWLVMDPVICAGAQDMFQQPWHRVDQIPLPDNRNVLAARVKAPACAAAQAACLVMGKAGCPLGSVTRLSQWVTCCLS